MSDKSKKVLIITFLTGIAVVCLTFIGITSQLGKNSHKEEADISKEETSIDKKEEDKKYGVALEDGEIRTLKRIKSEFENLDSNDTFTISHSECLDLRNIAFEYYDHGTKKDDHEKNWFEDGCDKYTTDGYHVLFKEKDGYITFKMEGFFGEALYEFGNNLEEIVGFEYKSYYGDYNDEVNNNMLFDYRLKKKN